MNNNNLSDIRVFKKNSTYRIGDLLLHSGPRWHIDRQEVIVNEKYKNTLLHKYFHQFKVDKHMWDLKMLNYSAEQANKLSTYDNTNTALDFKRITDQHRVAIPSSYLLIHLRCGDIVSPNCGHYTGCHIFHHYKLINTISKKIHSGVKKIVIISVMHYGADNLKHHRYHWTQQKHDANFKLLNELFSKISDAFGIPIVIDSENSPDLEFIDNQFLKLIYADNVILDAGGFSKIINNIRALDN
jgi:hypothetical protein